MKSIILSADLGISLFLRSGFFFLAHLLVTNTALAIPSARLQNPACAQNSCDEASAHAECNDELSLAKKDPGLQPWVNNLICYNGHGRRSYSITRSEPLGQDANLNDYQNGFSYIVEPLALDPTTNLGPPRCKEQCFGDPINAGVGNKFERHLAYRGEGRFPLTLALTYNNFRGIHYHPRELDIFGRNRAKLFSARQLFRHIFRPCNLRVAPRRKGTALHSIRD